MKFTLEFSTCVTLAMLKKAHGDTNDTYSPSNISVFDVVIKKYKLIPTRHSDLFLCIILTIARTVLEDICDKPI
jgi:hypothetical protein